MMLLLLFLLNFKGAVGFGGGYYNPSLREFNYWLKPKPGVNAGFTFGGQANIKLIKIFKLSAEVDWFKGKSRDEEQTLEVVPMDGYISIGRYILPELLYVYIHAGYEICYVNYKNEYADSLEIKGYGNGPVIKSSIEFLPTPRLGVELSAGYRFMESTMLDGLPKDPDSDEIVPMNLWGPFFKLALLREFR